MLSLDDPIALLKASQQNVNEVEPIVSAWIKDESFFLGVNKRLSVGGTADDPLYQLLFHWIQHDNKTLQIFALQFVPTLVQLYLEEFYSPKPNHLPGLESVLLAFYQVEYNSRRNQDVFWFPPSTTFATNIRITQQPTPSSKERRKTLALSASNSSNQVSSILSSNSNINATSHPNSTPNLLAVPNANVGGSNVRDSLSAPNVAQLTEQSLRALNSGNTMRGNTNVKGKKISEKMSQSVKEVMESGEGRENVIGVVLQRFNKAIALVPQHVLSNFCEVVIRLVGSFDDDDQSEGVILMNGDGVNHHDTNGNHHVNHKVRVVLSSKLLQLLFEGVHYCVFNPKTEQVSHKALSLIHQRASYDLHESILVSTCSLLHIIEVERNKPKENHGSTSTSSEVSREVVV